MFVLPRCHQIVILFVPTEIRDVPTVTPGGAEPDQPTSGIRPVNEIELLVLGNGAEGFLAVRELNFLHIELVDLWHSEHRGRVEVVLASAALKLQQSQVGFAGDHGEISFLTEPHGGAGTKVPEVPLHARHDDDV